MGRGFKMGASSNEWRSVLYTIWWSWTFLFRMAFAWTHWKELVSKTAFHNCFFYGKYWSWYDCVCHSLCYMRCYVAISIYRHQKLLKNSIFFGFRLFFFFELADLSPHSMFEHSKKHILRIGNNDDVLNNKYIIKLATFSSKFDGITEPPFKQFYFLPFENS